MHGPTALPTGSPLCPSAWNLKGSVLEPTPPMGRKSDSRGREASPSGCGCRMGQPFPRVREEKGWEEGRTTRLDVWGNGGILCLGDVRQPPLPRGHRCPVET